MSLKIEKIIVKYLTKSATADDLDTLSEWIKIPENKILFKNYVETHYTISYSMNNPNSNEALKRLLLTVRKEKSLSFKLKNLAIYKYTAAAIVIGIIASTYFFKDSFSNYFIEKENIIVNTPIIVGKDKATLTLEDGSEVDLEKGLPFKSKNATSNGKEIFYKTDKYNEEEIVYNHLTIPRGGQFFIVLSDGTEVWLNSESQLKYPVSFKKGETRMVELVYGEAYFDVSPSSLHNGDAFKVYQKNQEVQVLGTQFNIKAYKGENHIYTTLVEGKVVVNFKNKKEFLKPNQQSNFNIENGLLEILEIDAYDQISWKEGVFSFKEQSLEEIMKVLSRWYDVEVIFENEEIKNDQFIGQLRKDQSIEAILSAINQFGIEANYEFKDKVLILK